MLFIYHTIIYRNNRPVYFNVYQKSHNFYYYELLDNPHKIKIENFELDYINLYCSIFLPEKELSVIVEQIENYLQHPDRNYSTEDPGIDTNEKFTIYT